MINLRGSFRTKEECIEDAKKYKTIKEWSANSPRIYGYVVRKKWLNECTAHTTKLNGKSRTKEECIEDAKKYESMKEWYKNSKTIYGYAGNKKWLQEIKSLIFNQ